ncbi:MAG: PH domain-containing protein [Candidatus Saccharimonadales bacterium]
MANTFPGQHPDETIDFVFRQHPVVMRKGVTVALGVFAVGLVPSSIWPLETWSWWCALAGLVLSLLVFSYWFLGWYFSVYIITDERLIQIKQVGLFNRSVQDISHNRIQSVNYTIKGLQATFMKFGTVTVQTFAGDLILHYIHHPEEVQQHLNRIIRDVVPVDPATINGGDDEKEARTAEA